ncbi:ArsR/SmtB family transcription factor [Alicyclobacillus ferrooxydans]|uniref:Transcriptional regulator n=1 Tax=Alicyclobacillus ferrooxydans TaxID=471514 RepID=A0A0P9CTS8_9BACL|nr:metalloregulator ArsR/SmtB family transcription factor [Alicyclobacillus ferrooxydans]KPV43068.1 transcriptional regulator [Alicyclobacillus ferrooxydans]
MELDELADALKALGETTRLKIVALLNIRECCVCELVPFFGISQPAVSKHMSRLKSAGIVTETRRGQWVFYALNRDRIRQLCVSLDNLPDLSGEIRKLEQQGHLVCTE